MRFYLFIFLCIQIDFSYGQVFPDKERDKIFSPTKYNTYPLRLDSGNAGTITLKGINRIDVIDARPDTFALGYMKKGLFKVYKKIQFSTPGMTEVINFYKKQVTPDINQSSFNILLVVKELWLSEDDTDVDDKEKILDVDKKLYSTCRIKVKFDFYFQEAENYYPAYRFDTTLFKTLPLKTYASEFIQNVLIVSLDKFSNYDVTNISKTKTPVTMSGIQEYNNRRFQLAIINDTFLKRGVYNTFEEFKQNNPSITEFEIKKGKLGDELYTKSENGKWIVNRSVWGYCDENNLFIKSGDNYYQLIRIGNSFYFNGSRGISRRENYNYYYYGGGYYQREKAGKSYINVLSPFKLNIENGSMY